MKQSPDFFRALLELDVCGFIKNTLEIDRGIYAAGETIGWKGAARELAALLPGTVSAHDSGGLAWYNGPGQPKARILDWNNYGRLLQAKEITNSVIPRDERGHELWSVGGCAAALLRYVGDAVPYVPTVEGFLRRHPYGYHDCTPGVYTSEGDTHTRVWRDNLFDEEQEVWNPWYRPAVTLYDVQSYYYQMLRRLRSLRVDLTGDKVTFFPMRASDARRWADVLDAVEDSKSLRNSLCGVACGSLKPRTLYTSSRPDSRRDPNGAALWYPGKVRTIHPPGGPGPFRAAGLLVVATGAELCYCESLTSDSIYSTIDSVALASGRPSVWPAYGFTYEQKASGSAEFCHRGSWRVGSRETVNYANGEREYVTAVKAEVPQIYAGQWL